MSLDSLRLRFVRFAFHHFYNSFAWTYDAVSALVSLGHWREWTRAAIPHLRGARILEIAFGTGNLQVDMRAAGLTPFGLDLSPNMARIASRKLRRAGHALPFVSRLTRDERPLTTGRLVQGSVLALPWSSGSFDSLVLTFPPNFLASPQAVSEMRRVLAADGRIVIADAGWVRAPALLGALINLAFRFTGTSDIRPDRAEPLRAAGFTTEIAQVTDARSSVQVLIADKLAVSC